MSRETDTPSPAVTPAKMATIAALAFVLVVVLVMQFSGSGDSGVVIKKRTPRSPAPSPEVTDDVPEPPVASGNRLRWPEIKREEVLSFNPFATPDVLMGKPEIAEQPAVSSESLQVAQSANSTPAAPAAAAAEELTVKEEAAKARIRAQERKSRITRIQATAAALRTEGVGVVMQTSAGAVARIGEQEVRVGDIINGVLKVTQITPHGIVVEEAPEETTQAAVK